MLLRMGGEILERIVWEESKDDASISSLPGIHQLEQWGPHAVTFKDFRSRIISDNNRLNKNKNIQVIKSSNI